MKHYKPSGGKTKKRLLALVLAAALVCSSLMPVYANDVALMDDSLDLAPGINESKDEFGNVVITWGSDTWTDWTQVGDDQLVASPYPDGEEMDPGFAIPTVTYRFWLSPKDKTELAAFNAEVESGAKLYGMTKAEYIDLYGPNDGMFSAIHVADGGSLWDNSFKNPTASDAPDAGKTVFAGWYTLDEYGYEQKFTFDADCKEDHVSNGIVYASKMATVDVFAKWSTAVTDRAEQPKTNPNYDDTLDDHTYDKWYAALVSSSESAFQGLLEQYTADEGFCDWLDEMPEDEIKYLTERMDAIVTTLETVNGKNVSVSMTVGETSSLEGSTRSGSFLISVTHSWEVVENSSKVSITNGANTATATITAKASGTAVVKHTLEVTDYSKWPFTTTTTTDTFTITISGESSVEWEPLYLYALNPTLRWQGNNAMNSTANWYGIGIAKVKKGTIQNDKTDGSEGGSITGHENIQELIENGTIVLEPFKGNYTYTNKKGNKVSNTYSGKSLYPDLTYNSTTYTYWDGEGTPNINTKYYTIEWAELKLAYGANEGALLKYNEPTVTSSYTSNDAANTKFFTHHLDTVIHFCDYYQVQFKTVEPKETEYKTLDARVYSSTLEKTIKTDKIPRPEQRDGSNKYDIYGETEAHKDWTFSGWYLDEDLQTPAKFDGKQTVAQVDAQQDDLNDKVITYYGKWVRNTADVTIQKKVEGSDNESAEFTFGVAFSENDGQTVDTSGITATKTTANNSTVQITDWRDNGFTLKHNESVKFSGVPIGAKITVVEIGANDYEVTASGGAVGGPYNSGRKDNAVFTYTVTAATSDTNKNHITVTNRKATTTVTVAKKVTGLIGDTGKDFDFKVALTDKDGQSISTADITAIKTKKDGSTETLTNWSNGFTLKHNESVTFALVPLDAMITVTETNADGYDVISGSTTYLAADRTADTKVEFTQAVTEKLIVTVTNHKTLIPDAGVDLGSATPYLFLLCVGAVGVATLKRKRRS